jgi:hypothetical protein
MKRTTSTSAQADAVAAETRSVGEKRSAASAAGAACARERMACTCLRQTIEGTLQLLHLLSQLELLLNQEEARLLHLLVRLLRLLRLHLGLHLGLPRGQQNAIDKLLPLKRIHDGTCPLEICRHACIIPMSVGTRWWSYRNANLLHCA